MRCGWQHSVIDQHHSVGVCFRRWVRWSASHRGNPATHYDLYKTRRSCTPPYCTTPRRRVSSAALGRLRSLSMRWRALCCFRGCYSIGVRTMLARQACVRTCVVSWLYKTRAQLLLRWARNVAQVEFFAIEWGVPVFNALFLSNLWENRHKTRFFGLNFCRRQYE